MKQISIGYYSDFLDWAKSEDIPNKLMRVWWNRDAEGEICSYEYFVQFIPLPDGDILIGMQSFDDRESDNKFKYVDYSRLSEIKFAYCPSDETE